MQQRHLHELAKTLPPPRRQNIACDACRFVASSASLNALPSCGRSKGPQSQVSAAARLRQGVLRVTISVPLVGIDLFFHPQCQVCYGLPATFQANSGGRSIAWPRTILARKSAVACGKMHWMKHRSHQTLCAASHIREETLQRCKQTDSRSHHCDDNSVEILSPSPITSANCSC